MEPFVIPIIAAAAAGVAWRERNVGRKVRVLEAIVQERLSDRALVEELERSSRTDPLTGLFNRRHMQIELSRHLAETDPNFKPLAIALVDLDGFKAYNDTMGHLAGDRLLKSAATSWLEQLRVDDVLVRLGGDEFVAILPNCSGANAMRVANRLIEAAPDVACSIGVACWNGVETPEELLARADAAMYEAKQREVREPVLA
jgi:diguanylate cyclase (GGDEF)-like protein